MIKKLKAFTILEILLVVSALAILVTIVFIAINPAKSFAEMRNTQRANDVNVILNALNHYALYNGNEFPSGIDTNLRMVGTAATGCNVSCGEHLVALEPTEIDLASGLILKAHAATITPTPTTIPVPTQAPSGWVTPDSVLAPTGQWTTIANAIDNNTISYATNTYGSTGLGQYIYVTYNSPVYSNRLRLIADYTDTDINNVEIDVMKGGVWSNAFSGGNEADWNAKWVEVSFPAGQVTQIRFRYNYRLGGYYYWLYEMQLYRATASISLPTVTTLDAYLIQDVYATAHATLNFDGGEPCSHRIVYGLSNAYGQETPWVSGAVSGDTLDTFINGLSPATAYHFRVEAQNSAGISYGQDEVFSTKVPLVGNQSPDGFSDPDNKWVNKLNVMDSNLATYASSYHNIGDPQWSSYLYFNHETSFINSVSFFARGLNEVDQAEVDIMQNGNWTNVYSGGFSGLSNVTASFPQTLVSEARIRFHATAANNGFFWQLYEFSFSISSESTSSACVNLTGLVPSYVAGIPTDPENGSQAKTYYAVKKLSTEARIVVYACTPELNMDIAVER